MRCILMIILFQVAQQILCRAFGKDSSILKRVRIINGLSSTVLSDPNASKRLMQFPSFTANGDAETSSEDPFDFVFLDHDKVMLYALQSMNVKQLNILFISIHVLNDRTAIYLTFFSFNLEILFRRSDVVSQRTMQCSQVSL